MDRQLGHIRDAVLKKIQSNEVVTSVNVKKDGQIISARDVC